MIEPGLALQTAVRSTLIARAGVTDHVDPDRIRAGSIRPEQMPAIVLSPARVELLGRASGGQVVAEVALMLNLWVVADGSTVAEVVAGAMLRALMDAPAAEGFAIDEWDRPALVWLPDPDPAQSRTRAAVSLKAILRWRAD